MCELGWQMCVREQQQPPRLNPLYRGGLPGLPCADTVDPLLLCCQMGEVDV